MNKVEVGSRVGAISHSENNTLYVFGFGVYDGDFVPDTAAGTMGKTLQQVGAKNPKITLDNGKVVWGCECWWGPEDEVKQRLERFTVVETDIDEVRTKHSTEMAAAIPEDDEYVDVIQNVEGDYPEIDTLKSFFKGILSPYIGRTAKAALVDVATELLTSLEFLQGRGIITDVISFSVEVEGNELDVDIALVLPNGKKMSLSVTLKDRATENTTTKIT